METIRGYTPVSGFPLCEDEPRAPGRRPVDIWYEPYVAPQGMSVATHRFLMTEWDWDLNTVDPARCAFGKSDSLWWKCSVCSESWQAGARQRRQFMGNCPLGCIPKLRLPLEESHSHVFAMLVDKPKINTLFADLDTEVNWACEFGHLSTWGVNTFVIYGCDECDIADRVRDRGIAISAGRSSIKTLAEGAPHLLEEWHPDNDSDPRTIKLWTTRLAHWLCPKCGWDYWVSVGTRAAGGGCPGCHGKVVTPSNSLAIKRPDLIPQWHPTLNRDKTPYTVTQGSRSSAWWLCEDCDHEWWANIASRAIRGNNCPACSGHSVTEKNCLQTLIPELAAEWHPDKNEFGPDTVTIGTRRYAWWQCSRCNHSWSATILSRRYGAGCPACRNLGPSSKSEMYLREAIEAALGEKLHIRKIVRWTDSNGSSYRAHPDMMTTDGILIEYDGSYWHQSIAHDMSRLEGIMREGHSVILIRQDPLSRIQDHDLIEYSHTSWTELALDVVEWIASVRKLKLDKMGPR